MTRTYGRYKRTGHPLYNIWLGMIHRCNGARSYFAPEEVVMPKFEITVDNQTLRYQPEASTASEAITQFINDYNTHTAADRGWYKLTTGECVNLGTASYLFAEEVV